MAAKRGRSSPSALDREIDRLTRRLNALVARRDSIVKAATPRTSPATSRRTGSVERRALRALHEARRGIPLFEAARNNGTTIAAIRRRVPEIVKEPGGGWAVPLTDSHPRRAEVLIAGGRIRSYYLPFPEAQKYSAYLRSLAELKEADEEGRHADGQLIMNAYRRLYGPYLRDVKGRRIQLTLNADKLRANLARPGVAEILAEGPLSGD